MPTPTVGTLDHDLDLRDLDATATLALLEDAARRRRAAEVDDLLLCLRWADLHAAEHREPGLGTPDFRMPGGDRLVGIGGDGTPGVSELSLCELAIARGVHHHAARHALADSLDLRHRMPMTWVRVRALECDAWVARKIAVQSRHLAYEVMHVVDAAVADAISGQSPARVLELAAAKIIEADQAAHDARLEAQRHRRFVGLSRRDDTGLRNVIARVTDGDAHWVDQTLTRLAEILAADPAHHDLGVDELRSVAFGLLAQPLEVAALLDAEPADPTRTIRPRAVLYVHLHEAALAGVPGVARVEGLGPHTLTALEELLRRTDLVVKPVLDLADHVSANAYEFPEAIKERLHLRWGGDAFPHANRVSRSLDHDHAIPYDPHGPPGQTSSRNGQPLSRTPHRAKTHLAYSSTPTETGEVIWRTPHGLHRIVDGTGTHALDPLQALDWSSDDPLDRALTRIAHRWHTGQL